VICHRVDLSRTLRGIGACAASDLLLDQKGDVPELTGQ
jgi:hypothetical protein